VVLRSVVTYPAVLVVAGVLSFGAPRRMVAQTIRVTPDNAPLTAPQNTSGQSAQFTLRNLASSSQTFYAFCYPSGAVTSCSPNQSSLGQIPPNIDIPVGSTFSTGPAGSGTITLKICNTDALCTQSFDYGSYNVTVDGTSPDIRLLAPAGEIVVQYPTIQLAWCDNTSLNAASRWIKVNGVLQTSSFDYVANSGPADCTVKATSTTSSVALTPGRNQIDAYICDNVGNCTTQTFLPIRLPQGVAVRAQLPERQHFAGTSGSQRFFVKNLHVVVASFTLAYACTGTASGCAVTPTTLSNVPPGESRMATLTYSVGAAGTGTGLVKAFDTNFRDSATVAMTSIGAPAPVVSVVDVNPGTTLRRDLCVTIAAGSAGAIECGDLRIVHTLSSIRTLNKSRTPTLLYNSAHAELFAVVPATVTLASSGSLPDSVQGVFKRNGVAVVTGRWGGSSDWALGATRRIALAWAVSPDTIRPDTVYDYTLEVTTIYAPPTGPQATAVNGKLIVVDRRGSGFGAGWSLAGLERIRFLSNGDRLWVGGDGSARVYQSTPDPNVWVAPADERPDTLKKVGGGQYYRAVPGGAKVWFSTVGQHDSTVNRLGHRTAFGYNNGLVNGLLTSITLPTAGGGQSYSFAYDSSAPPKRVVTITAPGARVTTLWLSSMRVDSIRDPDNSKVRFTYKNGTSRRIASRTDRRGTVTSFSYDSAQKLSRVHTNLQPDSIQLGFAAIENQGLFTATPKTAIDTANAYTVFYGPRQYATRSSDRASQQTLFYLDRLGAVRRLRDPLNQWTTVRREDGQWPALPTDVVAANGFETRAGYDARGNTVRSVAVNPLGDLRDTVTRYHWDPTWDAVDSIITPMGVTTTMMYDGQNGNRLWQQMGSDPARRVTFRYGNAQKLLSSTVLPQTPADSIVYDGQWNLAATRTPKGFWTSYYKDALGRDTLVVTPIDSTDKLRGAAADSTIRQRQRVVYTVMDRDSIAQTIAPNRAQTITAVKAYDSTGNLLSLSRASTPDTNGIGTVATRWRYDRANRRVAEVAPDGMVDSSSYDPAGNPVELVTRRKDPTTGARLSITMRYNALNRLIERALPPVSYPRDSVGLARFATRTPLNRGYPYYPNNAQDGYTVYADTGRFAYTALGNDSIADSRDAMVRRWYYPNGMLQAETLMVRTRAALDSGGNFSQHRYGVTYRYDWNGRRTVLKYPAQLAPASKDSARFGYDVQTGALTEVWDLLGHDFVHHYNFRGELDRLSYPPGTLFEAWTYNDDGALVRDVMSDAPPPPAVPTHLRETNLTYDARQKVLTGSNTYGVKDTLRAAYTGLGHLLNSKLTAWGVNGNDVAVRTETYDTLVHDALANLHQTGYATKNKYSDGSYHGSVGVGRINLYQAGTGRLVSAANFAQGARDTVVYDSAGSTRGTWQALAGTASNENRLSYYAADGAVRAADYRRFDGNPTQTGPNRFVFEEYRYDAYGRRVWVRARRVCDGITNQFDLREYGECNTKLVRRTVWDGFQELAEIQQPGGDSDPMENDTVPLHRGAPNNIDENSFIGRVLYTYGTVLDQPLSLIRLAYADSGAWNRTPQPWVMWPPFALIPFWNHLGEPDGGGSYNSESPLCRLFSGVQRCVMLAWPFAWSALNQPQYLPYFWHGTLTEGKRDKAQTLYRRNRVYDPSTGRFTQEDPIGLAGGLNLYGFASGDPVNFSDPFGLCHDKNGKEIGDKNCREVTAAEGQKIYDAAVATGQWTWTEDKTEDTQTRICHRRGDCTDHVEAGMEGGGAPALDPRPATYQFAGSSDYVGVTGTPQVGDVIVQGGHAGTFSGKYDGKGRPLGIQNGGSGTAVIPWGKGVKGLANVDPVFYRRKVPINP